MSTFGTIRFRIMSRVLRKLKAKAVDYTVPSPEPYNQSDLVSDHVWIDEILSEVPTKLKNAKIVYLLLIIATSDTGKDMIIGLKIGRTQNLRKRVEQLDIEYRAEKRICLIGLIRTSKYEEVEADLKRELAESKIDVKISDKQKQELFDCKKSVYEHFFAVKSAAKFCDFNRIDEVIVRLQGEYDKKKSFIVGHMKETEDKNDREDADYTETKKIPLRKKVVVEPTESVQKDNDDEKPEESE